MPLHDTLPASSFSRPCPVTPGGRSRDEAHGPHRDFPVSCRPVVDMESGVVAAVSAAPAWSEIAGTVRYPRQYRGLAQDCFVGLAAGAHTAAPAGGHLSGRGLPLSVLEPVCREYSRWSRHGDAPGLLLAAVGAPRGGRDVARAAAVAAKVVSGLDLDPARVVLVFDCEELQEEPLASLNAFLELKRHGLKLGIDFSDIEHLPYRFLEMLPADYLRVGHEADHGLSPQAAFTGPGFAERLKNVCAFAENLLMDVIVAGVDSASKYDLLADLRCRFGQGAYFPAVSPSEKSFGLFDTNGPPPGL
ncbi:EAL domain-containing protein [Desulfolutivibrio sulfodismutans DSM 3696]|nr:EAL domain-containing protein [Desulfolutivibrio sulfodismutans]QLA14154.1 EAL domain-containing protein [Desulfolutivibrio sulfodismutans DSM 3696]